MSDRSDQTGQLARVFSDVRDFAIFISRIDDTTSIPAGPWRAYDGLVALVGLGFTGWRTYSSVHSGSGHPFWTFVIGALITGALVLWARQIPITRPTPMYRLNWLINTIFVATRKTPGWKVDPTQSGGLRAVTDRWLGAPRAVIDNLRFTQDGVYAHFLLSGQPGSMDPFHVKEEIAKRHAPLARNLPSGFVLSSWLVRLHWKEMSRRMLGDKHDQPRWRQEVRDWEHYFKIEPFFERTYGLTVPIDNGDAGSTKAGALKRVGQFIVGTDQEEGHTLDSLREASERIISRLPRQLGARQASSEQILWMQRRALTLGVDDTPMPAAGTGRSRLKASDFTEAYFDEGNRAGRQRHWWWPFLWRPRTKSILRIQFGNKLTDSSFQAMVAVAQLPRGGLAFPKAEFLMVADDADFADDCRVDTHELVQTRPIEAALQTVDRAETNLWDQFTQRSNKKSGDADIAERLLSAEDYSRELRKNTLEKEVEFTAILAVGSASQSATLSAVETLQDEYAKQIATSVTSRRGTHRELWQINNPGSERRIPVSQFNHPTTVSEWAKFSPLMSSKLGNDNGILLGLCASTKRPSPVFLDLEGARGRRGVPVMLWKGPMGTGKSMSAKRVSDGINKRGGQQSIIENGPLREWVAATDHHSNRAIVDLSVKPEYGFDPLQCFPREQAVERMLDHLAPMMAMDPEGHLVSQIRYLLRPDQRVAEKLGLFVKWLDDLTGSEAERYGELRDKFGSWSTLDYLRPIFDPGLKQINMQQLDTVLWLVDQLELPTMSNTDQVHLYRRQPTRARAGMAVYGLITVLTRLAYANRRRFGMLWVEEARTYLQSPIGQSETLRQITQCRKEDYGLGVISQFDEDFAGIGTEAGIQQLIMPMKNRKYAKKVFENNGIDPEEYPEILETRVEEGHAWGYLIDEFGRPGLVDLLPPAQPELVEAFDTSDMEDTSEDWDLRLEEDDDEVEALV
ncbi:MAG: ATP-binding protein [[Mycobacterium] stephanolepidis]